MSSSKGLIFSSVILGLYHNRFSNSFITLKVIKGVFRKMDVIEGARVPFFTYFQRCLKIEIKSI